MSSACVILIAVASVLIGGVILCFPDPILRFLGTDAITYQYTKDYMMVLALGMIFIVFSNSVANIIRSEGAAKESMIGNGIGTLLNMVLDPLFIFGFRMGSQPIIAFKFSAKNYDRTKSVMKKLGIVSIAVGGILTICCRINFLQSAGKAMLATVLSIFRQFICYVPAIYLFHGAFGLEGVFWVNPLCDAASILLAMFLLVRVLKKAQRELQTAQYGKPFSPRSSDWKSDITAPVSVNPGNLTGSTPD